MSYNITWEASTAIVYSRQDVAYEYLRLFFEYPTEQEETIAYRAVCSVLDMGFTAEEILKHLKYLQTKSPGGPPNNGNLTAVFSRIKSPGQNILRSDQVYYHNQLRCIPSPPRCKLDYDTGVITCVSEPFYMEYRASYTLNDLLAFYTQIMPEEKERALGYDKKRFLGAFAHMVKQQGIDLVLFSIDAQADAFSTKSLTSPFDLQDYLKSAKALRNEKINEVRIAGLDQVVPKQRPSIGGRFDADLYT
jgi:hypothetical protein